MQGLDRKFHAAFAVSQPTHCLVKRLEHQVTNLSMASAARDAHTVGFEVVPTSRDRGEL